MTTIQTVSIQVLEHRGSKLLMAVSKDLKGFMVPGRSYEELETRIPLAIQDLLEATGHKVISVCARRDIDETTGFGKPGKYSATAQIAA